jgi:hypothetical protein
MMMFPTRIRLDIQLTDMSSIEKEPANSLEKQFFFSLLLMVT